MDDGELERLVDEAAEVLVRGLGLAAGHEGAAVRVEFMLWFGRRGLDDYAQEIGAAGWDVGQTPSKELTALRRSQLRQAIGRPSDPEAADELRAVIDRLSQTVLRRPEDGDLPDIDRPTGLPLLPEPTGGDLVDFRSGTFNGPVVGVQHVSNTYGAPPPGDVQPGLLDWPLAKDVEPRTHGVRPTRRMKGLPALPPYVGRDQDRMANWALVQASSEGGLVVVLGPAYVGKSRTALAAMAQVLPEYRVFAPAQHEDLRKLPAQLKGRTERCAVWLDDLDVHLGNGGLEPRLLGQLTEVEAVVLATMREEAYAKYARRTSAQGRLLGLAQLVELPRAWGPAERKCAEETGDPRLIEAARESGTVGVATYLAIGPRLWNDWQLAPNRERHPRAHALVRAAVDLARCGLKGPLPQDLLVTVHEGYGIAGLERESLEDAWEWAGRKRYGVLHMLSCGEGEQGRFGDVLPYFVHTAEQDEGVPPVAGWVWGHALEAARVNPAAYDVENVVAGARAAYLREAEAGDGRAMHALGLLEESLGEGEKAESWFRRAAEAGRGESAGHLGRLLVERGENREAERYLELAAEAGEHKAATLLGKLLRDRAAKWFRAAAESGNPEAAHQLGDLLVSAGDLDEADNCYLAAERYGYAEGARSAGMYYLLSNSRETAHIWLTRAAEAGDVAAVELLMGLEGKPESLEDAGEYFSAPKSYPLDNTHHGVVLEKLGHLNEARKDYEKGYEAGDSYAAYRLAALLEKQGNVEEAKLWYRKAADMGHPAALKALAERTPTPDTVKE
ncbi:tetratricopeptide repeat protein [Streptomyces prunicolor]|uniref:Tetratricopeptide repeat protein n=1 Tax=Streptomyces prunicolor TaxID=67348 RepID=A0ABU4FFC3_9ACTN|nr:tetratricopeptide repeat protein [Streptomyces prunicolor]